MPDNVQPGESLSKITAAAWNRHDAASEDFHRRRALGEATTAPYHVEPIKLRNDSGANRRAGDILAVGAMLLDELQRDAAWFEGTSPTECEPFGILVRPLVEDEIGTVAVAGAARAYVEVSDSCHRYATVSTGSYTLQSAARGPVRILSPPDGTGEKLCLVAFSWQTETGCEACDGDESGSGQACAVTAESLGLDAAPGYNTGAHQALTQIGGCMVWVDIEPCEDDESGSSGGDDDCGQCTYQYDDETEEWYAIADNCGAGCECGPPPVGPPEFPGATVFVDCVASVDAGECDAGGCAEGEEGYDPKTSTWNGTTWVPEEGASCPEGCVLFAFPFGNGSFVGEVRSNVCCPLE